MNREIKNLLSVEQLAFGSIFLAYLVGTILIGPTADSRAAVTNVGAILNPPPAGGGNVVGAITIGDGAFGSVTVTGGTAVSTTASTNVGNGIAGVGVLSLSGFGSDWTITGVTSDLAIADEGVATVTVASQAKLVVPDDVFLGNLSTASGSLAVTGFGSLLTAGDDITVGAVGAGFVDVTSGGGISSDAMIVGDNSAGRGSVAISGEQSRWTAGIVTVGDAGVGRIDVASGGRLTASAQVNIGAIAASAGIVDVSGVGTTASFASAIIGSSGNGTLQVRGGAAATSGGNVTLGNNVSGVGVLNIDGLGSRLAIDGNLSTPNGEAYVTLSNGGLLRTTTSSLVNSRARVTLAGGRWESTDLGFDAIAVSGLLEGSGIIDVVDGVTINSGVPSGRVRVAEGDHMLFTSQLHNNGLIDLEGGELETFNVLNNSGEINARDGAVLRVRGTTGLDNNPGSQIAVTSGTVDVYGAIDNNGGAEIAVVGGSTGVFHDVVTNNGTIFVSASSEIAMLENLGFAVGSELGVQLASIDPTTDPTDAFGLVDISGAANLTGTLSVSLASGFTADLGDTYEILRASGGRSGTFSTESLPSLGSGLALDVQYTANSVLLAVVAVGIPGDYNNNGVVDAADYVLWRNGGPLVNEVDTPGVVNAADYTAWRARFGNTSGAASGAAGESHAAESAVPEPENLVVWALVFAGIMLTPIRRA